MSFFPAGCAWDWTTLRQRSLAFLLLSSEKSISNIDDSRLLGREGCSDSWVFSFDFCSEGKCRLINFSSRRSSRVRSIRSTSKWVLRASTSSSVRGRYTPFGWKPGL